MPCVVVFCFAMVCGCCVLEACSFLKGDRGRVYPGEKRQGKGGETMKGINLWEKILLSKINNNKNSKIKTNFKNWRKMVSFYKKKLVSLLLNQQKYLSVLPSKWSRWNFKTNIILRI